jgi:hypothetical protein
LVAGRTQAHLLNYEQTIIELFGADDGLAEELRFPLFLSSITGDAVASLKAVRARVPKGVLEWVQDSDTSVEPDIAADQRFDFKIYLVPYKGAKTEADAAMTFVHEDELTDEQRGVMDQVRTIIRDRTVPVGDVDEFLPRQVVEQVNAKIDREFTLHMHMQAWRHFEGRRPSGSADKYKTKIQFCYWNKLVSKYVYTPAWVNFLVRKLFPCAGGRWLLGRRPTTCTVVQYCSYGWRLTSTSVWAAMDVEEKFDDSRLVENFGRG